MEVGRHRPADGLDRHLRNRGMDLSHACGVEVGLGSVDLSHQEAKFRPGFSIRLESLIEAAVCNIR